MSRVVQFQEKTGYFLIDGIPKFNLLGAKQVQLILKNGPICPCEIEGQIAIPLSKDISDARERTYHNIRKFIAELIEDFDTLGVGCHFDDFICYDRKIRKWGYLGDWEFQT